MSKSLNSRPAVNPRPGKSLISDKPVSAAPQQMTAQAAPVPAKSVSVREQVHTSQESAVSEQGIQAFINKMSSMVSYFAVLDNDIIAKNLELAVGNGMSVADRTVTFECAEYVISNLPYIFMGIVLNSAFKDAFIKALAVELSIDEQTPDVKQQVRSAMTDNKNFDSLGSIVIGMTSFTKQIEDSFFAKMNANFDALDPYAKDFDDAVAAMSMEDKMANGVIFSNFMYLIRAFTHNDNFMGYVISVVESVKTTLQSVA